MLLYSEVLWLRDNSDCDQIAAPTSRVCASPTVIQMITEYHIIWNYAALQWHNVMTKNSYYH
jgi:hypothetical protein